MGSCLSKLGIGCRKPKDDEVENDAKEHSADEQNQDKDQIDNVQVKAPEVQKVENKLGRQQSRLGRQESRLGRQESRVGGQDGNVGGQASRVGGQEGHVGGQEVRVGGQEGRVGGQEGHVGGQEGRTGGQEIRVGGQESRVGGEGHVERQESPLGRQASPREENKLEKQENKLGHSQSGVLKPNQENIVEEKTVMPQNPTHKKTASSAGLQIDSVLKRKSGNVKEFYTLGKKLGHGQFGTTFLCVEKASGEELACKTISKRKLVNQEDIEDVRREIEIMHHLKGHPNVITIKDAFEDAMAVHVIMELCSGGELFDRIIQRGHYSERKAAELARTIVSVVETCHSLGVMHRDLKPENFLFVNQDEESPLKTIDFGLSIFFKPGDVFSDVVGSPYYVAPEVLRKRCGPEADVWSAGVIVYILLCGVPPFWAENEEDIFEEVLHGELDFTSDPWPNISDDAKDLVRGMLVRDPKKRSTAHDVLSNPWIMTDGVAPDKPLDHSVISRLQQFSAMNKLKKMALRVIAERLSEEEIAGLKQMFKMIDTDNSGQITFEELKQGLKRFGADLSEAEIRNLMKSADVDNSGAIDYGEFIAAMLQLQRVDREDHLFAAFSYFDKDGSGFITRDELQEACQEFGINESHLEDIIREVDQDNDGRIDYNEFVVMMQKGHVELGKIGLH